MNKQGLVIMLMTEKISAEVKRRGKNYAKGYEKGIDLAIKLIEAGEDEPQKPVIPQFVADCIEECKKSCLSLMGVMYYARGTDVERWLILSDNQETFALAWINGYTVEEEKRYRVSVKNVRTRQGTLNRSKKSGVFIFSNPEENNLYDTKFTHKELEDAGFGEVFNSPLFEVEEVK